ncbi:MAG: molybdopterin-dependent oxidoreductase [Emcibacter sp.]|nr:molybdopterin-dependent oxidoreductase [Emcibacter sp.]
MAKEIKTTCPYCGVGCGVIARTEDDGTVTVRGDKDHPANFGKLCSKGGALGETLGLENRLLSPEIRGEKVSWDNALQATAQGLNDIRAKYGSGAIGFYVSGQLLTEDYYVANKLMKGFIGTANIDTNSRLCMSSSVAGHKRAFGSDTVPGNYEDWDQADLVILVGSNAAWCHPILFQRLMTAQKERGTKIVVIDPRRTPTCATADLHLPLKPGADVRLFNGLLAHLSDKGFTDTDFVKKHTSGMDDAVDDAAKDTGNIAELARNCGLSEEDLIEFFDLFSQTKKVLTVYSQGVNQSSQGTDKVNAIINCHLLTGRIGKPGMGPFSITGQPNAMGGREVGGLANTLAAHMEFDAPARNRVSRFWQTTSLATEPGLKAVDMFRAVHEGRIKAIWIMATNPAVSMPDANYVREALEKCELVIVSDVMKNTDTMKYAHISLPAQDWGEKDGTVTNSERRISRQRRFITPPAETRPDWWVIANVAKHMGFGAAFDFESPRDVFNEHAALSSFENDESRDFDLSGLCDIPADDYENLIPVQWPVNDNNPQGKKRFFDQEDFFTDDKRAHFIAVRSQQPGNAPDAAYPLIMNSGRIRDHWHTMTRTGRSPTLNAHQEEPVIAVHPQDARKANLSQKCFVKILSRWGEALVRVNITDDQTPGQIFMPMHWNDAFTANAVVGRLVNPVADPISGQPESKHTPVRLEKWTPKWHGFLLSRTKITPKGLPYWCYSYQKDCHILELAGDGDMMGHPFLLPFLTQDGDCLTLNNPASGQMRISRLKDDKLDLCLFTANKGGLPDRSWLQSLFQKDTLDSSTYSTLLSGQPLDPALAPGPIVCACFGVSQKAILAAITQKKATTVDDIGDLLKAGSNCGSCRPEIKKLIDLK